MPSESAERILEAATRLFGERGYPSTSMRDIGEAVGLLAGSLYSHISSKEAVLFQIVETGLDRYLGALLPIVESDGPADRKLRAAVQRLSVAYDSAGVQSPGGGPERWRWN